MEMNVHLVRMFYEATQQVALPPEQRVMMPEMLYQRLKVEMGKFDLVSYL